MKNVKHAIAYYLPQYHEIEENNLWWGKGYTEWTCLERWEPLFNGHKIIRPAKEVGYYNLEDTSVIEQQYKLAASYGIDTFAFWYYWFSPNNRLLEKPLDKLLMSDSEVQFCLSWANHSWFNKTEGKMLKRQSYEFKVSEFYEGIIKYISDRRYRRIDKKPVLIIYNVTDIPKPIEFCDELDELSKADGMDGFYFIFENTSPGDPFSDRCQAMVNSGKFLRGISIWEKIKYRLLTKLKIPLLRRYQYKDIYKFFNIDLEVSPKVCGMLLANWDTTPRHKNRGVVVDGTSPSSFALLCKHVSSNVNDDGLVIIKSWNEWAEGNAIEPSDLYGREFLDVYKTYFKISPFEFQ